MHQIWGIALTPGAAFVAGIVGVIVLLVRKRQIVEGIVQPERITAALALSFALYTLLVLVIANFFNVSSLSASVVKIGDDRVAILFMAVAADIFGRYYRLVR